MIIADIQPLLLRIPLRQAVAGASYRPGISADLLREMDLIVAVVRTDDGVEGMGYTYAIRAGGEAIHAALVHDVIPRALGGHPLAVERLWHQLYWGTYNSGRRGVLLQAIAALDIALWDIRGKVAGLPLYLLLGGFRDRVPLYGSDAGWLSLSLDELVRGSTAYVERGFTALKIMVGQPDPAEDVRRVAAVRQAIGDRVKLMVDAGQKWDVPTAVRVGRRMEQYDIAWLEEPVPCEDVAGHAAVAAALDVPIAAGQTLGTHHEVKEYLAHHALDVVQIDVARIGGITEWMKAAVLAETAHLPLAPHFLMELHVHLAAAVPNGLFVEYTPWFDDVFVDLPSIVDGHIVAPDRPGHGLVFRQEVLEQYRVR